MTDKVTLYFVPGSIPARACLLLLRYLNIDVEIKLVDLAAGEQFKPEFLKLNPLHKIPVLVDGDFVLTESRAILGYLVNSRKPGSSLYPSDPKKRAIVDQRLYYEATVVCPIHDKAFRPILYFGAKEVPTDLKDNYIKTLQTLEGFFNENEYIAGKELTIADILILPNITSIVEFGVDIKPFSKLSAWFEKMKTTPGFDENLEGARELNKNLEKVLERPLFE